MRRCIELCSLTNQGMLSEMEIHQVFTAILGLHRTNGSAYHQHDHSHFAQCRFHGVILQKRVTYYSDDWPGTLLQIAPLARATAKQPEDSVRTA